MDDEENLKLALLKLLLKFFLAYIIIFHTPIGTIVRPYFTSTSSWWEGSNLETNLLVSSYGTGFYINESHVVTNEHVIRRCEKIKIRSDTFADAQILAKDSKKDLAILKVDKTIASTLILQDQVEYRFGKIMYLPNYTSNVGRFILERSIIKGGTKKINNRDSILFGAGDGRSGNSGAPILDEKGYVIGVNYGWRGEGVLGFFQLAGSSLAVDLKTLKLFLRDAKVAYYQPPPSHPDLLQNKIFKNKIAVMVLCGG